MIKYFLFIFLGSISFLSTAQPEIIAFEDFRQKWGFCTTDGTVVIEPEYIDAHSFTTGGVALVKDIRGEWKIIDRENNIIQPFPKYDVIKISKWAIQPYRNGMLNVMVKHDMACINSRGEVAYPPDFDVIHGFVGDHALAELDHVWYILDREGNKTKLNTEAGWMGDIHQNYVKFRDKGLFGLLSLQGEVLIEPRYKKFGDFVNGVAWARNEEKLIGFIDVEGNWLIDPKYKKVTDFDEQFQIAQVNTADEAMYLRLDGTTFKPEGMIEGGPFHTNVAWVRNEADLIGFIDHNGNWLIEPKYDRVEKFDGAVFNVRLDDVWGIVNNKGVEVVAPKYTAIEHSQEGIIGVRVDKKWGFLNIEGIPVTEIIYDAIDQFYNGYAAVRIDGKWGLINTEGAYVIQPKYHRLKEVVVID